MTPSPLYHFTEKDSLHSILKGTFRMSFARENIIAMGEVREFLIPMVSFSDWENEELKKNSNKYGGFGIGLSKDWANRNKLNAVWYVNRDSDVMWRLMSGVTEVYDLIEQTLDPELDATLRRAYMNTLNTYRFIKNYRGHLIRKGVLVDRDYPFYDEREWRFVPPHDKESIPAFIPVMWFDRFGGKDGLNKLVENEELRFDAKDIESLVVPSDTDVAPLRMYLDSLGSIYDAATTARLKSLVVSHAGL